jgi:hypothetical protein
MGGQAITRLNRNKGRIQHHANGKSPTMPTRGRAVVMGPMPMAVIMPVVMTLIVVMRVQNKLPWPHCCRFAAVQQQTPWLDVWEGFICYDAIGFSLIKRLENHCD